VTSWSPADNIIGALYHKLYTQSSAPEDGRNYRPKHVELIEIINKIIIVTSSWLFILLHSSIYIYIYINRRFSEIRCIVHHHGRSSNHDNIYQTLPRHILQEDCLQLKVAQMNKKFRSET